jgi:peptide/nickel transport system substrate-binding protein
MQMSKATPLALILVIAACDRKTPSPVDDAAPGGSLVAGISTNVVQVIPPLIQHVDQKLVADQIFEPLAWLGDEARLDDGFRPALADSWTWENDSLALAFHLNAAARWQDGQPVRASDVKFTYALYTDSVIGSLERSALLRIDSVSVRDSLTPVFHFTSRYADQLFDAAARMLIVPEHLLAKEPREALAASEFAKNPVGSGRFRVLKWDPQQSIELVADTNHYRGRPKLDRVVFSTTPDPNAMATRLAAGDLDAAEILSAEHFRTLSARPEFTTRVLPAFDYAFLQFNLRDPKQRNKPNSLFADVAMRRALTMGLDRTRIVRSQFDTLAAPGSGPMTQAQPLAAKGLAPLPYDSAGAARLLDSLGWKLPPGKAVRERNGQPLRFMVMVPSVSRNRMGMVVRVQEGLRTLGVQMEIDAIDPNTFIARLQKRDFDMAFNGTHAEVSIAGLRPYWTVAGAANTPMGRNFGSYQNPVFDAHLDSALTARAVPTALAHARTAYTTIAADFPAVWMYEMRSAPVIHRRFRTAHIVPGAWWLGISEWSIPTSERIPRDKIGLRVAAR